jgi:NHL repeat.
MNSAHSLTLRILETAFLLIACMLQPNAAHAQSVLLDMPVRVAVDAQGNVFVTEAIALRIAKFAPNGSLIGRFTHSTTATGEQVLSVSDLAIDPVGNVLVLDRTAKALNRYSNAGVFIDRWQLFPTVSTVTPSSIAVASTGRLFVSDDAGGAIYVFSPTGQLITGIPVITGQPGPETPGDLVLDGAGNLYAVDRRNHRILKFGTSGPPANPLALLGWIGGLALDQEQRVLGVLTPSPPRRRSSSKKT